MAKKLPRAVIGWRVFGPVKSEHGSRVEAISGKFQIHSAAEEFLKLAVRGSPEAADQFYIGSVTKVDRSELR